MKNSKLFLLGLAGAFFLNSCSTDDDGIPPETEQPGDYANGVLILNEGSQSAGTVSYLDEDLNAVEHNIFEQVNQGMDLGLYVQSIFFDEENAYIISNGSNMITVVDRYTFEYKGAVDNGLNVPVYGTILNGKAYVTNIADFGSVEDDYVAVIDLETLEVEEAVVAGGTISEIVESNGMIYIEGASYGTGNAVRVFNPNTNSIEENIVLFENEEGEMEGLNSLAVENGSLYALTNQNLYVVDAENFQQTAMVDLSAIGNTANLDIEDGMIYFTSGTSVYAMQTASAVAPETPVFSYESSSLYGQMYGFEVENGLIYTSDAGDFASAGSVAIYDTSGIFIAEFSTGVAPNNFYFN
ncbi:quinoprotein amine dehydrogenase [Gramella sp. GC03-9]|uniref:Quinoprotein amine dehydrogenase n=1 Tax=Christiangramia oceanisediminis TaxID=2920386 RepID=A0A9X2R9P7_9FLAO|nr:DUF5074 domain-containing protein [Gramella oceanisediminis]MCP9200124.1 quinoprotein amine dehydrogenase [Gramella oceanisediminis]